MTMSLKQRWQHFERLHGQKQHLADEYRGDVPRKQIRINQAVMKEVSPYFRRVVSFNIYADETTEMKS